MLKISVNCVNLESYKTFLTKSLIKDIQVKSYTWLFQLRNDYLISVSPCYSWSSWERQLASKISDIIVLYIGEQDNSIPDWINEKIFTSDTIICVESKSKINDILDRIDSLNENLSIAIKKGNLIKSYEEIFEYLEAFSDIKKKHETWILSITKCKGIGYGLEILNDNENQNIKDMDKLYINESSFSIKKINRQLNQNDFNPRKIYKDSIFIPLEGDLPKWLTGCQIDKNKIINDKLTPSTWSSDSNLAIITTRESQAFSVYLWTKNIIQSMSLNLGIINLNIGSYDESIFARQEKFHLFKIDDNSDPQYLTNQLQSLRKFIHACIVSSMKIKTTGRVLKIFKLNHGNKQVIITGTKIIDNELFKSDFLLTENGPIEIKELRIKTEDVKIAKKGEEVGILMEPYIECKVGETINFVSENDGKRFKAQILLLNKLLYL